MYIKKLWTANTSSVDDALERAVGSSEVADFQVAQA